MGPSATSITTRIKTMYKLCTLLFCYLPKCDIHYNKD